MRDLDTIGSALTAAETGHLVLATLHTNSAAQTINRIIDVFPPHQQEQIRVQLSEVLAVEMHSIIQTGSEDGMQSFDQSLKSLVRTGQITIEEALKRVVPAVGGDCTGVGRGIAKLWQVQGNFAGTPARWACCGAAPQLV